jgi:NADPH:quinone reductase-like Zn-dependent oxidoreductase
MVDFLRNVSGTYAEHQVVDVALIARKPQHLTHVKAAALPLAAGTAYEMITRRLASLRESGCCSTVPQEG